MCNNRERYERNWGTIGGSLKGPCAKMFLPKSAKIKYHIDKELLFQDNENLSRNPHAFWYYL